MGLRARAKGRWGGGVWEIQRTDMKTSKNMSLDTPRCLSSSPLPSTFHTGCSLTTAYCCFRSTPARPLCAASGPTAGMAHAEQHGWSCPRLLANHAWWCQRTKDGIHNLLRDGSSGAARLAVSKTVCNSCIAHPFDAPGKVSARATAATTCQDSNDKAPHSRRTG